MNYDFKSDSAVLSHIIYGILPNSVKGKWSSFEEIMNFDSIKAHNISKEQVIKTLHKEICCRLFWSNKLIHNSSREMGGEGWVYKIDPNCFFTLEERQDPNCRIHKLM
jgi:hypothetical protein